MIATAIQKQEGHHPGIALSAFRCSLTVSEEEDSGQASSRIAHVVRLTLTQSVRTRSLIDHVPDRVDAAPKNTRNEALDRLCQQVVQGIPHLPRLYCGTSSPFTSFSGCASTRSLHGVQVPSKAVNSSTISGEKMAVECTHWE
jgi:hypothetical protein